MIFDQDAMQTIMGGLSTLDVRRLHIDSSDEAGAFLRAYGYDPQKEEDVHRLWDFHRKAVTYLQTELLKPGEQIPSVLTDPNQLGDIVNLLVYAGARGSELQQWACAILKIIHIYVHLENDLFAQYSNEIQDQILKPIQTEIHEDPILGTTLGPVLGDRSIIIKKFEVKNFKTTYSSVTKLLAKRQLVAFSILDKVGVRIVTKTLYDVFRVVKYFIDHHIVSFPHNISDQSNNTLYPLNLFLETVESLPRNRDDFSPRAVDEMLWERLNSHPERAQYLQKRNDFTSDEYKFVKFVTRRLVRIPAADGKTMTFFYPYEVQIVDYETHLKNSTGTASHDKYKERQVEKARARVLKFLDEPSGKERDDSGGGRAGGSSSGGVQ